jgi:hypothetical protein
MALSLGGHFNVVHPRHSRTHVHVKNYEPAPKDSYLIDSEDW